MLIDDIKKLAKENKVIVLFDMDGVLAEYRAGEKEKIESNEPNFYLTSRPIKYNIKQAKKISKLKNVRVGIQSNCHYTEQAEDKKIWIKKHAPFVDENNINIIALKEIEYEKETKYSLKAKYIKNKYVNGEVVVLIDDEHRIIKEALKQGIKVYHVSSLIH